MKQKKSEVHAHYLDNFEMFQKTLVFRLKN